ncbi:pyrimidine dimer DNA glycosylase/endonuclease V [Galactobacter valiniphilus]|uniref:pyrimidine dimer DNA glycosylase/endonuclease V n=1 Tax=Galactobacter valiniphilus TaxID=2676122 RepID=UPI003735BCCD
MRLWSLHPQYLDAAGLVACWRESLLAQKVLRGLTRGYTKHPQLQRWREQAEPVEAIGAYLHFLHAEATARGYRFDASRIAAPPADPGRWLGVMSVSEGQLALEREHLRAKLEARSPDALPGLEAVALPHPLFVSAPGPVAAWERA